MSPRKPEGRAGASPRTSVRRTLQELGRRPRKQLGQHFLTRPDVAQRIVQRAHIEPGTVVVEIGPGLGALTEFLAPRAAELWLVELDADFASMLRARYADSEHVHVVQADACRIDWRTFALPASSLTVVGNLPYNIATPLLMHLLEAGSRIDRITVMVQREVAERLRARPGEKAYSALSVLTQALAEIEKGFRVPPAAFSPPPKVDSEVVVLRPRRAPAIGDCSYQDLRTVVRAAFGQRRKQLRNSLAALVGEPAAWLQRLGIAPQRRAETLTLEEFATLARSLHDRTTHA